MPLIRVEDLHISISRRDGSTIAPVRGVSLAVEAGETLALVGESGCGKSLTCLAIAGLLPRRARVSRGQVEIDGADLVTMPWREARALRRRHVASVFQDATNALNPVLSVGWQVAEAVRLRQGATRAEAAAEAVRLLGRVGLPEPERRAREFPHQFSGGMNQRAMIALAIAGRPQVLIADEATTALDVTIQAQILDLIADLQAEMRMGVIFVTHDLGIVAQAADQAAVMYAGRIVETAPVAALFAAPHHPYTRGLLGALPRVDRDGRDLATIEGIVPPPDRMPAGCAFAPRCGHAAPICGADLPSLLQAPDSTPPRSVACFRPVLQIIEA
jgi:peptide/nickel transport system ATP-binding protein